MKKSQKAQTNFSPMPFHLSIKPITPLQKAGIHLAALLIVYAYLVSYQQEIKRELSEHLISPDMITKKSLSA
ncbi:hypothetical protein [Parablautia muri]|uniref:Uncharacterized protein n=1 Tax=Parablautia muri TaxID=2320879 RepID=A0A9X5BJ81_9FIRM|nr:hypothetical protein [Parablautia muri]NBJ94652.1 hypothetical protein [Parablautia muri]